MEARWTFVESKFRAIGIGTEHPKTYNDRISTTLGTRTPYESAFLSSGGTQRSPKK